MQGARHVPVCEALDTGRGHKQRRNIGETEVARYHRPTDNSNSPKCEAFLAPSRDTNALPRAKSTLGPATTQACRTPITPFGGCVSGAPCARGPTPERASRHPPFPTTGTQRLKYPNRGRSGAAASMVGHPSQQRTSVAKLTKCESSLLPNPEDNSSSDVADGPGSQSRRECIVMDTRRAKSAVFCVTDKRRDSAIRKRSIVYLSS